MGDIVNKVAQSGIITIDLGEYYPAGKRQEIDLKDQLWQGMAIREKDFREFIKEEDWSKYQDSHVAVHCSVDAIVPTWAFMLVAAALADYAKNTHFGIIESLESHLWTESLRSVEPQNFVDARVVIKGCSDKYVSPSAFMILSSKLKPVVRSLMYGEPCSTVPIYKKSIRK